MTTAPPNPTPNPIPTYVHVHQPPGNGLGVAGFVTSLVGLITCGAISPIGLLLSLIAIFRRPRGFALAGTIIGLLGTVWVVIAGFVLLLGVRFGADYVNAHSSARKAFVAIGTQNPNHDITELTANAIAQLHLDPWNTALRAEVSKGEITIISAGRDKQFGTRDDLRYDATVLQSLSPPTTRPMFQLPSR